MSTLTSQALHIVLQHCMLPNLGWYPHACERHVLTLREEILAHQSQIFEETSDVTVHQQASEQELPYDNIELDEIEKNSSKYLQGLKSLLQQRDNWYTVMGNLQIKGVKNLQPIVHNAPLIGLFK
jgi:hypothetical protein